MISRATMMEIARTCAVKGHMRLDDILRKCRQRQVVRVRTTAYCALRYAGVPILTICKIFNTDHSTVARMAGHFADDDMKCAALAALEDLGLDAYVGDNLEFTFNRKFITGGTYQAKPKPAKKPRPKPIPPRPKIWKKVPDYANSCIRLIEVEI